MVKMLFEYTCCVCGKVEIQRSNDNGELLPEGWYFGIGDPTDKHHFCTRECLEKSKVKQHMISYKYNGKSVPKTWDHR